MKKIRIYQINENVENARYFMFSGLEMLEHLGLREKLSIDLYNMVWEGEVEDNAELDDIFTKFNVGKKPEGFTGHSLSVSDVVEMDGKYYYCDDYGWEELSFPTNTIKFSTSDIPETEETGSCTPAHLVELRKEEKVAPYIRQYREFKAKHADAVLLFRCGDFYEAYENDAVEISRILGITLTYRPHRGQRWGDAEDALAGFPHHALDIYLPKLVRAGKRIAFCDQLEDPRLTKKLVKRGITEQITPKAI